MVGAIDMDAFSDYFCDDSLPLTSTLTKYL